MQSHDEGAAHAMERVVLVPGRDRAARGIRVSITTQKPKRGSDRGMRLWLQRRPEMVAVFGTVVSECAAVDEDGMPPVSVWVSGAVHWRLCDGHSAGRIPVRPG